MAVQIVDDSLTSNFVDDLGICGFLDDQGNFLVCSPTGAVIWIGSFLLAFMLTCRSLW